MYEVQVFNSRQCFSTDVKSKPGFPVGNLELSSYSREKAMFSNMNAI